MGKAIGALTRTGVGNSVDSAQYFDSPQQAFSVANNNLSQDNYGDPSMSMQGTPTTITPGADGDAPSVQGGILKPNFLSNNKQLPDVQKPNFLQASQTPGQKGMTKAGTLVNVLLGGLAGAAAGAGSWTPGEGFARATGMAQRKQQLINQQKQQDIENQQKQEEERRQQQQADQQGQLYNSEITKNAALTGESNARTNNKDLTPQEIYASDIKAGLTPEEAKQHAYKINPAKPDANPTEATLALRAASGDAQAMKALGLIKANKEHPGGNKAADHADRQADAEDQAGRLLDAAGGDPNKAMELFNKALATGKVDRYHLSLAPSIRNSIRGGRRVQNADPLAGLLNNSSPQ